MTPEIGKKFELLGMVWIVISIGDQMFKSETTEDRDIWLRNEDAPKLSWLPEPVKKYNHYDYVETFIKAG